MFGMLAPFFKGNQNLELVVVDGCNISPIGKRMLSLALEGNTNPRLKVLIENGRVLIPPAHTGEIRVRCIK